MNRWKGEFDLYEEYIEASVSLPKAYLFPKFYIFYDDAHLLPAPYFRYQYLDTVHLRIEEREMDIGVPDLRRLGWGFNWSVLDPQVLSLIFASREYRKYSKKALKAAEENVKNNFRLLLRVFHILKAMLDASDSAILTADTILKVADTLLSLKRFPPEKYLEFKMEILKLERVRSEIYRQYEKMRDTLRMLTGVDVRDVDVGDGPIECLPYDSTHLARAQTWVWRSHLAYFFPKILAFGEVWHGRPVGLKRDSSGLGTLYGLRFVWTFDETGRLKAKRENISRKLLNVRRDEMRSITKKEYKSDTTFLSQARSLYEEAKKLHDLGRLDIFTLFKIKLEYYSLKLETLKSELEVLKARSCPVILPEFSQRTP